MAAPSAALRRPPSVPLPPGAEVPPETADCPTFGSLPTFLARAELPTRSTAGRLSEWIFAYSALGEQWPIRSDLRLEVWMDEVASGRARFVYRDPGSGTTVAGRQWRAPDGSLESHIHLIEGTGFRQCLFLRDTVREEQGRGTWVQHRTVRQPTRLARWLPGWARRRYERAMLVRLRSTLDQLESEWSPG